MWTEFNAFQIDQDFATIQQLGATSVRVIIQVNAFGWPTPSASMQARLAQTIQLAANHNLQVQLTLFDFFGLYTRLSESATWAKTVLQPYKNDSRIAFVELQNELNPSNVEAIKWMQYMIPVLRDYVGSLPVTVSVTNCKHMATNQSLDVSESLALLIPALGATPVDFYDVHYYGGAGPAAYTLNRVKQIAGSAPVFVGETGLSSWDGIQSSSLIQEMRQDMGLRTIALAAKSLGFGFPGIWILQDFPSGQVSVGQPLGSYSAENFYGLIRVDGSWKPAAFSQQQIFQQNFIDAGLNEDFSAHQGFLPINWFASGETNCELTWDGSTGRTGAGSVKLSHCKTGYVGYYNTLPITNLTAEKRLVTVSGWAKTRSATGLSRISIDWFSKDRLYLSSTTSASLAGTTDWRLLSTSGLAPAHAAYCQISLKSEGNTGIVWFDDITLRVES
ncbi:hypothetical protein GCM10028809_59710 [Spirosoma gilvum]